MTLNIRLHKHLPTVSVKANTSTVVVLSLVHTTGNIPSSAGL